MKISLLPLGLIAIFILIVSSPLRAETTSTASSSSSSAPSGGGEKPVAGTQLAVPDAPTVTEAGKVKPMDRQKSSAMAKAMAAAGAQQSAMACMQMMQAAQGASGSDKALMLMMANQSCQQSKEMAKSADENDKSQKQLSADDIPKQSVLKVSEQKIPTGTPGEDNTAMAQYQAVQVDEPKKGGDTGDVPVLKPLLPEIDLGKEKTTRAAASALTPEPVTKEAPNLPKSVPGAIDAKNVNFADGKKLEGGNEMPQNSGPNLNGIAPNTAGVGKSPAEEAKLLKGAVAEEGQTRKKSEPVGSGEGAEGGGSGSGGGGGSSSSGEKGPDPFEAMLAQLMGGPPPDDGPRGAGGDMDLEPRKDRTKPPNIFEYATFRYLKLVDQKKLRNKPGAKPALPRENSPQASLEKSPKLSKR